MQQQPNSQPNFPNPDMSSEELQEFFNDPENQARIKVPVGSYSPAVLTRAVAYDLNRV